MARYWYGDSNDWSLAAGGDGSLKLRASTKKYYDAESGGSQYTDLLIGGVTAATQVATNGLPVRFQGPDGVTEMWESANDGPRVLISTTDQDENVAELAAQVAVDRAAVEAVGTTTDTVIAGRINASGSATQVALTAAIEAGVGTLVEESAFPLTILKPLAAPPTGFRGLSVLPTPTIRRAAGVFVTDLDITALRPAAGVAYYTSPTGAGTGTTAADPCSISTALAKSDIGTLYYLPGDYYRELAYGADLTKSLNHIAYADGVRITGWNAQLTWTNTSGNIYETSRSSTLGVLDIGTPNSWGGAFTAYIKKANLAAITGPGQWALVGSTVYVWAIGNFNLATSASATHARIKVQVSARTGVVAGAGTTQYVENIDFVSCRFGGLVGQSAGCKIIAKDCTTSYAAGSNGVSIDGGHCVLVNHESFGNDLDGLNYHAVLAAHTEFIEIDCYSHHNGLDDPGSNNATTSHEDATGIRVNGNYDVSGGPVVADVNSAHTWNLGCRSGASSVVTEGSWRVSSVGFEGAPVQMWLDECTADSAPYTYKTSGTGAVIHIHGCGEANPDRLAPASVAPVYYTR